MVLIDSLSYKSYVRSIMNNFISFNVSKRLNKIISNPGKILINGVFKVSIKIINATNDTINTIKLEKNYSK